MIVAIRPALILVFLAAAGCQQDSVSITREDFDPRGDPHWKFFFLKRTETEGIQTFKRHDVHPTRGWVPQPNVREALAHGAGHETTNNRGHRSAMPYEPRPDAFTILVIGDSFTYGVGVDDADAWPAILQAREARFQVINAAVGGYGLDQMYLTQLELIAEYDPDLVVFAPITEDLHRTTLSFREYRKPRYTLDTNGELLLTNTPIGDATDTLAFLRAQYGDVDVGAQLLAENEAFLTRLESGDYNREWTQLSKKLLEASIANARDNESAYLLVHLASGGEVEVEMPSGYAPVQVMAEAAREGNVPFLETCDAFLDAGRDWSVVHYTRAEAELVADLVYAKILTLDSWRNYAANQPGEEE